MKLKLFIPLLTLFFCSQICKAAKVDTLEIKSSAMNKTLKAAVSLPDSYAKSKRTYPVIYLLHGAFGKFSDWLRKTPDQNSIKALCDQHQVIIVMPEGEGFSFYIDSPVNPASQFETFITSEVILAVDKKYRTIASKDGRAITGLSMGGHGALSLSAKHPELYSAAGSMSGAVDIASGQAFARIQPMMAPIMGTEATREAYAAHSVLDLVPRIRANSLPLIIDCGISDFLIEANRELHRRLAYEGVPHDYTERPGAHTWEYWEAAIPYHVLFFRKVFDKAKS
jgi:S-formylglutathione hydrolase FrmB